MAVAANVTGEDEMVVVGSQAILGSFPDAPPELLRSMEADIYPRCAPQKADEINGALGDGSPFHALNGYYAHGVGVETAKAPAGWESRLVVVPIPPRLTSRRKPVAMCREIHDLVLSKLAAGRERDWNFARTCVQHELCDPAVLLSRVEELPIGPDQIELIRHAIEAW